MLLTVALVLVWLRPKDFKRLIPLGLPLLIAIHFALPGTLGSLKNSFFPAGGLIQEQRSSEGSAVAAGRVADLAPSLDEFSGRPILGQGYGSRIVIGEQANARLLDNQWLGLLLETGIVGILGFAWLISRAFRRVALAAKSQAGESGWLLTAIAASLGSFAVGMFFFDAFAFIQVMFLLFILIGFGMSILRMLAAKAEARRIAIVTSARPVSG
jgi:O-antigen ligase